jgi:hypothetical protein
MRASEPKLYVKSRHIARRWRRVHGSGGTHNTVIAGVGIEVTQSETKINLARVFVLFTITAGVILKSAMVRKAAVGEKFLRGGRDRL